MSDLARLSAGELAALVCTHLATRGISVVLSGGACVEVLTEGLYVSLDLDLIENVASARRQRVAAMRELGFEPEGRHFVHADTPRFVEFPTGPLAVGGEPPGAVIERTFATGTLALLSPTDCVKDRLAAFYHWDDQQCLEQALLVAARHAIDHAALARWSMAEGQAEKLAAFRRRLE